MSIVASPSASLRQIETRETDISPSVPSSTSNGFTKRFQKWMKDPYNIAIFVFILCVTIPGLILFLVMTGVLNQAIPEKSDRDIWSEVNNQILNALFTLLCLYLHPKRLYHVVLLFRWKQKDISTLRIVYCKNGKYKANERKHMAIVVFLLNVNCFAQYVICGLCLGFKKSKRPGYAVGIFTFIAILSPTIAGIYMIVSPLGKEYESDDLDEESQSRITHIEKRYYFAVKNEEIIIIENNPKWKGGLCNICDDFALAYLSLCCSCCIFGWNMERLGFGNMYVHIVTFLLICFAPFLIFNLAAININNDNVKEAFSITGFILLIFGLLYGGFWRIQMRKRFNLPENKTCFRNSNAADFSQWLFCCCCSLAQEVRTANFYDVVESNNFPMNQTNEIHPLPLDQNADYEPSSLISIENCDSGIRANTNDCMVPPTLSVIRREDHSGSDHV